MADETPTYYYVKELTGGYEKDAEGNFRTAESGGRVLANRTSLLSDVSRLYRKYGTYFVSQESWLNGMLGNTVAQQAVGLLIRPATEEDLEEFSEDIAVFEAIHNFKEADRVAAATKAKAREVVVGWFGENVKDEAAVDYFFNLHKGINPWLFASWIKEWEKGNGEDDGRRELPQSARDALKAFNQSQTSSKAKKASPKGSSKEQSEQIAAHAEFMDS